MSRRGWALFLAMCVIWGLPYLFIRIAVEHVSPGALVWVRTGLGTLVLLPIALMRGQVRPVLARWQPLLLFAVIEIMVPWMLLSHAEQEITSSLAGLLVAAVPLFGALAFLLTSSAERFSRFQLVGLFLGFTGVASLVGLDLGHLSVLPIVEMVGVAICYAAGPLILTRWLSDLSGLGVMSCSLGVSALVFTPIGLAQWPSEVPSEAWLSIVVLALVCTALAFLLFVKLIAEAGPTRATVITYVNPAVALTLGVLLLDEPITTGMLVGFPMILVGCVIAAGGSKAPVAEAELEPAL